MRDSLAVAVESRDIRYWHQAKDWHVTLSFQSHVTAQQLQHLIAGVASVAKAAPSFELPVRFADGIGFAKPYYLALHLALNEPLIRLKQCVDSLVYDAGLVVESRQFVPHVSLAKIKDDNQSWRFDMVPVTLTATSLALYQSTPAEHGVNYNIITCTDFC